VCVLLGSGGLLLCSGAFSLWSVLGLLLGNENKQVVFLFGTVSGQRHNNGVAFTLGSVPKTRSGANVVFSFLSVPRPRKCVCRTVT
jgi:hypothetical protein